MKYFTIAFLCLLIATKSTFAMDNSQSSPQRQSMDCAQQTPNEQRPTSKLEWAGSCCCCMMLTPLMPVANICNKAIKSEKAQVFFIELGGYKEKMTQTSLSGCQSLLNLIIKKKHKKS